MPYDGGVTEYFPGGAEVDGARLFVLGSWWAGRVAVWREFNILRSGITVTALATRENTARLRAPGKSMSHSISRTRQSIQAYQNTIYRPPSPSFCRSVFRLLKLFFRVSSGACAKRHQQATSKPLVGDANDTAGRAGTSVASLLGLLVAALAEVVGAGVADDGALIDVSCAGRECARGSKRTPMTLSEPISLMSLSWTLPLELPWPSVLMLPRSPTWRSSSPGAPWVLLWGLTARY